MSAVSRAKLDGVSLTGSVTLLGLIGFAGQLPIFLLTAFGGAACITGSILFGSQLKSFKHKDKRLITALQMTVGKPASKAVFQEPTKA